MPSQGVFQIYIFSGVNFCFISIRNISRLIWCYHDSVNTATVDLVSAKLLGSSQFWDDRRIILCYFFHSKTVVTCDLKNLFFSILYCSKNILLNHKKEKKQIKSLHLPYTFIYLISSLLSNTASNIKPIRNTNSHPVVLSLLG